MPTDKNGSPIDPVDAQIGGDGDIDGIAQTLTADDINAVLMSPQPAEQRLESLKAMRAEIEARSHADFGNDMGPLLDDIDAAIAQLSSRA
ncbi:MULTISPECIES: hypothetical protein [Hoeflea]|jgi:hypothetical protein|uniref:Anti-sigma-28 factor FlgM C-terminal domain-containing protein n=1 Tax=Hoeflea alexandrii TaxID=288436 RepID=A0ABT1CNP9_9HYPH|nr:MULTISPECIES: hypothetical protein [Hoeflea]MCO6407797.1 hypothetical protein [Hoeflea alexandrii]VVT10474.1 conserved hypothetical protein [Hoeflea sp. EC-HK425]|tara:strand:- start:1294 stop:1563 length:270 start_codon:yes stop_codon:yes gene_type:complete